MTFSFLIREANYQYRISHKSFRDYLTARSFVREINNGSIEHFPKNRLTEEIEHFIMEQKPDKKKLLDVVLKAKVNDLTEENQWQGSNAVNLLLKKDRNILKGLNLSGCRMRGIYFKYCNLTGTKLEGADLSDCLFNKTILQVRFTAINAANSRLNLYKAEVKDISFLKEFKGMADLYLDGNGRSDISVLKYLTGLSKLELQNNQLTYISPLQPLKQLRELYIHNNPIPDDQTAALKEALPGVHIEK